MRYSSLSPDDLVKLCAGSTDPAVWQEFIRRFQPVIAMAVLRTARHWGEPSPQMLDDLVQETYLKLCDDDSRLLRSFESRHPDSIFGFLKVVASNIVQDHFKAALAEKRGAGQVDSLTDEISSSATCDLLHSSSAMDRGILLRQIDEALTLVAGGEDHDRNRLIFWLYYRDGLTASGIASLPSIGLTTKGVESILHRMTKMIRSHVEGTDPASQSGEKEGIRSAKSL